MIKLLDLLLSDLALRGYDATYEAGTLHVRDGAFAVAVDLGPVDELDAEKALAVILGIESRFRDHLRSFNN